MACRADDLCWRSGEDLPVGRAVDRPGDARRGTVLHPAGGPPPAIRVHNGQLCGFRRARCRCFRRPVRSASLAGSGFRLLHRASGRGSPYIRDYSWRASAQPQLNSSAVRRIRNSRGRCASCTCKCIAVRFAQCRASGGDEFRRTGGPPARFVVCALQTAARRSARGKVANRLLRGDHRESPMRPAIGNRRGFSANTARSEVCSPLSWR